jgi:hypothetical protein
MTRIVVRAADVAGFARGLANGGGFAGEPWELVWQEEWDEEGSF